MYSINVGDWYMDIEKIRSTIKHRKAYRKVARDLGVFSLRHYLHDLDKIVMHLFIKDRRKVSRIHRRFSSHHDKANNYDDFVDMVIDWECARFTKPDKPLNARETLHAYYPHLVSFIEPILDDFGL